MSAPCHRCGRPTAWNTADARVSPLPTCVTCWDRVLDSITIDADNAHYLGKEPPARTTRTDAIRAIMAERYTDAVPGSGEIVELAAETGASLALARQIVNRVMAERM